MGLPPRQFPPCQSCGATTHPEAGGATPDGLWQHLNDAVAAFQLAATRDELLRTAARVLLEVTGAQRVDATVAPAADAVAMGAPPPTSDQGTTHPAHAGAPGAPLTVVLCARDGRRLGELVLHPGDVPFTPATALMATTVAQAVALVLAQMELVERWQAEVVRHDRLLGAMAHAVRHALDPVVHALPLLASAVSASPTVARAHGLLAQHAPRAAGLLDDLLDLRRAEAGQLPLHRVSCTLGAVVERAVAAIRPEADGRAVRVEVHGLAMDLLLMADLDRLVQACGILLHNAVRVTPRGGVVVVRLAATDARARVAVVDHGGGIAANALTTLFTPHADAAVNAAPTTGASSEGMGVNLALARHLAVLHGGTLHAHSDGIGRGSTFTLELPATPLPAHAPFPVPRPPAPPGGAAPATSAAPGHAARDGTPPGEAVRPLHILVVDDHHDAADALALLLAQDGHRVTVCYEGEEALRRQRRDGHEVVLLDIGLPGSNGYDVARAIRSTEAGTPALLVALTGWGQPPDRRRSFEAGFDHHLVKPVAYPALRALLRHWTGAPVEAEAGSGV